MKRLILLLTAILILVSGCSKRAWYDGFQSGHNYDCGKLEGEARDKCVEQGKMSYDQYEKLQK
jgi:hypothetical protein